MQHSEAPWKELARAKRELDALKAADDIRVRLDHWIEFLRAIERLWNKAEAAFSRSPKWQPWQGKYVRLRRTDGLLCYMAQARNMEEHSDEPSAVALPGSMSIGRGGGEVFIEKLVIDGQGKVAEYRGSHPIEVTPPRISTRAVDNRGVQINPPTSHLGHPIASDVTSMADAGFAFYKAFLEAAEAKFVT